MSSNDIKDFNKCWESLDEKEKQKPTTLSDHFQPEGRPFRIGKSSNPPCVYRMDLKPVLTLLPSAPASEVSGC